MVRGRSLVLGLFVLVAALANPAGDPGSDRPERASDPNDRVICKRFVRTGSLVDGYRECKTKWEWQRERDDRRQLSVSDSCRDRANGGALCDI